MWKAQILYGIGEDPDKPKIFIKINVRNHSYCPVLAKIRINRGLLYLDMAVTSLMYHCKYINSFCFCESLLFGRKCVQFKWFSPISQYLDDVRLEQWFPTGGSQTHGVPKQHFRRSEMQFSRVRICMLLLDVLFVKITKISEILQVLLLKRTLSNLTIPANVTYWTIKLVNARIAISASRCGRVVKM